MIKATIKITQASYRFCCHVDMLYIDQYGKTNNYPFDHEFMNISGKYDFDLSAICISVMAISAIDPIYRDELELRIQSQMVVDIANKVYVPDGIYKVYGNKLSGMLDQFKKYKIIKY